MENELFVKDTDAEVEVKITKITCPHCQGEIIIEKPVAKRRGALAGLTLEEMSDEQLKRELINSKSVLYKAVKRGAPAELIAKNELRVAAAVAEKAKRTPAPAITVAAGEPAKDDTDAVSQDQQATQEPSEI